MWGFGCILVSHILLFLVNTNFKYLQTFTDIYRGRDGPGICKTPETSCQSLQRTIYFHKYLWEFQELHFGTFFIVLNENCSLSLLPSFVQIFKTPDLILHYFHGLIFLHFWFGTCYKATLSNTSTDLLFYMTRWYSPPALDCPVSLLSVTLMICTALCLYYLSNWNL